MLSYLYVFSVFALLIILLFMIIVPISENFLVHVQDASTQILEQTQEAANQIQNETIKNDLLDSATEQINATQQNIDILSSMFKYSAFVVLFILAFVVYIYARERVEVEYVQ